MLRKPIFILLVLAFAFLLNACNSKPSTHTFRSQRVTMRKFAIDPDVIRVKQGEDVVLTVSTEDVQHGFEVNDVSFARSFGQRLAGDTRRQAIIREGQTSGIVEHAL